MNETTHLSQGMFVERPKGGGRVKAEELAIETATAFDNPSQTIPQRVTLYKKYFNRVENVIQELEATWNDTVAEQVGSFVQDSLHMLTNNEFVTPVGFVPIGLSTEENKKLFDKVEKEIRKQPLFLARVNSCKCPNVKMAFQNICKQLLHKDLNVSEFHEMTFVGDIDDTMKSEGEGASSSSSRYQSVHDLQRWYDLQCPTYYENPLVRNSPSLGSLSRKAPIRLFTSPSIITPETSEESPSENESPDEKRPKLEDSDSDCEILDEIIKSDELVNESPFKMSEGTINEDCPTPTLSSTPQRKKPRSILKTSTPQPQVLLSKLTLPSPVTCSLTTPTSSQCNVLKTPKSVRLLETPTNNRMSTGRKSVSGSLRRRLSVNSKNSKIIVIILENCDFFQPNVIPQILQLLSCSKLPVLFIFGVSQSLNNLNRFIPLYSSSTFNYTTFQNTSATQRLSTVLEKVLTDPEVPFKLSGRILNFLSEFFSSQHFSVTRLLQAYKICLVDHFRKAESIFCTNSFNMESFPVGVLSLSYSSLEKTKTDQRSKGKAPSAECEFEIMKKAITEMQNRMEEWLLTLHFLWSLQTSLHPFTMESFTQFYISCATSSFLEGSSEDKKEFTWYRILNELRSLKHDRMDEILTKVHNIFKGKTIEDNVGKGRSIGSKLEDFINDSKKVREEENNMKIQPEPSKNIQLRERMNKADLQKTLMEGIRSKDCSSPFLKLRESFIQFVEETVRKKLKPLTEFPNSQIFVYDDLILLKSMFSPLAQRNIVSSLQTPARVLKCDCCKELDSNSINQSLPDTSILFKLLMEQTAKKIDLNPIYESFVTFMEPEVTNGRRQTKKRNDDPELYLIRFRQAVAELQHTGVIKRNKSKPDEITKLLWF